MPYSTQSDLYSFGLPRGAVPNPGRHVDGVESSILSLGSHGFATDDPITLRPASSSGALPPELSEGVTYYAVNVSHDLFRVAAAPAGAPLTLTDSTDTYVVVVPLDVGGAIAWADALIDNMLPAHVVPITGAVPEIIRMTSAELAAAKLASVNGATSDPLSKTVDNAMRRIERWAKGVPLRGDDIPTATNLSASATVPFRDARGWSRFGGL